jgi:hypothetical protein
MAEEPQFRAGRIAHVAFPAAAAGIGFIAKVAHQRTHPAVLRFGKAQDLV